MVTMVTAPIKVIHSFIHSFIHVQMRKRSSCETDRDWAQPYLQHGSVCRDETDLTPFFLLSFLVIPVLSRCTAYSQSEKYDMHFLPPRTRRQTDKRLSLVVSISIVLSHSLDVRLKQAYSRSEKFKSVS